MRRDVRPASFLLIALAAAQVAVAQSKPAADAATPYVEVFVRGEKRDQKVAGRLTQHDGERLTIETAAGPRDLTWDQLTPSSGFTLKARLIDKTRAPEWIEIGRWAWQRGLESQARTAFAQATKIDGSLSSQVSAIVATASGSSVLAPTVPATASRIRVPATKPTVVETPAGEPSKPMQRGSGRGEAIVRYGENSPEADAASIALSRQRKGEAEAILKVKLAEVVSDHFLIYTDWDPAEHGFLKEQCEGAYRAVAKQFDRSPKDNVFVGKLPIYMFAKPELFRRFAKEVDDQDVPETVLGYFVPVDDMGHMAMWKPAIGVGIGAGGTLDEAKRNWARTLVHEFCHAFIHRYKSNARIPRWLNEGTAELISEATLPSNNYYANARAAAQQHVDVSVLFDEEHLPTGAAYPVMMTLVECLVNRDRRAYLLLVNDLKDGVEPDAALLARYKLDYPGLAAAWQAYASKLR